ncbi:protoporphyrinogen oxidase [Carboxylicivirga mesophila]|uniref:Coproporphyrinogen III oxidase n=1 Tax=Carboxylicivirga mesophila TaxID=1166478 RepID=A0ABS5K684_9BACT|nr:protoporphyrinogen oxidase [Carboxylicivirga mesophila]MBS2210504.1 protoporphyrinogen oxidase [Carboxylicivirga mesophila]
MNKQYDVVILGAGVTGLTLAHKLNKKGINFCVLDKQKQAGGVINTQSENGFVFESGPNSGIVSHPEVVALFDELGDAIKVEKGNDLVKIRYVLKNGEWHALPHSPISAVSTPLFTLKDKFRILGEPFRAKGTNPDETLAELVKRRMGNSFLDYAIDPFILGIYAGDPAQLVTRYAMPKLYNLEQTYGSFIGGARKKAKEPKTELEKRTDRAVFSIEGGLSGLTNALLRSAGESNFCFGASDVVVNPNNESYQVSYTVDGTSHQIEANKVITTFGSVGLDAALPFVEPQQMQHLTNLRYARVVEVSLGFDKWDGRPLDGFGGLIPHKEQRNLLGVLFMSSLFKGRAPEGGALLTIFMGGVRNEGLCDLNDNELLQVLEDEFIDLMKVTTFDPSLVKIKRYAHAIPQYGITSGERFQAIYTVQQQYPGLIIAGNLRDGIGMADRIKQATLIAKELDA